MTALAKSPVLRTSSGEPPLGRDGAFFRDDQGEIFEHDNPRYRSAATRIGVLALDNGKWLALPPGFAVQQRQHDSRDEALRAGIFRMIRRARRYRRNGEGEGTHWNEGFAGRVIEWALALKPAASPLGDVGAATGASASSSPARAMSRCAASSTSCAPLQEMDGRVKPGHDELEEIIPEANSNNALAVKSAPEEIIDPVVRQLVAAHRARKLYPAGHLFSMTNPIQNGRMVTLGTCSGGDSFSYEWGSYERMDAAIEAHWQKFDHLPEKVDGRGQPVVTSVAGMTAKNAERAEGASVVELSPAQICESADDVDGRDRPGHDGGDDDGDDEADLAIAWPSYDAFLEDKIVTAPLRGIEVRREDLHPWLKPHCKDLVVWSLRLGCAAIFASFGLHKTAMQLEWTRQLARHTGQPTLSVVPLGVRHGFIKEALQLDMDVRFVRTTEEVEELAGEGVRHFLTNYESIREGKLDPNAFEAVTLDEASCLRSYGSKTFQEFLPLFARVPFKLVATATPSPNRYKELIHYAGFLGVMDTGLALTRWFQRNSEKAGDLTLYPHKADEFWMWVHSWAAFLQKPSELGHSDAGYELPPLKLTWHEVPADHSKAVPERDGQSVMFRAVAASLSDAAKARRDSLPARIAKMVEIIAQDPGSHRLIWHDLEAEREAIEQALPEVVTITGSGMSIEEREQRLLEFEEGRTKYFATKPTLSGSGSNFQYHCHKAIYVALPGYGYKFNDFIQSLYRLQRFGQQHPVEVDIIYSEDERQGRAALEEKWGRDGEMRARMSEIIRAHGLNTLPLRDALLRSIGVQRVEIRGERFIAINNDAVAECRAWPDNSVDEIITSIPFGNQYEYSASYRDFGHSDDSAHFWSQMDFLSCELLRMLKPGRLACIHVKDRVLFGSVTGEGVPTISPFYAEAIMHYRAHGFQYLGMIHVNTDVVRENNQTYRLGWSENAKDSTKMGVGCPEYVLLLRKRQSDRSKGYADVPVTKQKPPVKSIVTGYSSEGTPLQSNVMVDGEGYSRARWQIDAHAFWRSSGNRLLTPEEFAGLDAADHAKLFAKTSTERVYDYEAHVRIGEALERKGTLPATFMAIAPGATCDDTWHDVNRMRTLNMHQQRKGAEMHLCPLQFDIVDRLIERYSSAGELIFDPFGGLMTVPYRAILKGRRGAATELSAAYFLDGVSYLRMAEEKATTPQLFDLAAFDLSAEAERAKADAVNTPPADMMESEAHG